MTLQFAQNLMMTWVDDLNQGYFKADQTIIWLNMAQRFVQDSLLQAGNNWYVQVVGTNCVIGQTDYLYPIDQKVIHRLELVESGYGTRNEVFRELMPITINQQGYNGLRSDWGLPECYIMKKDRFSILKAPDQEYPIRIHYSAMTDDMVSPTDTLQVPEQFTEYVVIVAAFDGFIKDDRAAENLMAKKLKYEKMITQMAQTRRQDVPRRIVQKRGDWR